MSPHIAVGDVAPDIKLEHLDPRFQASEVEIGVRSSVNSAIS